MKVRRLLQGFAVAATLLSLPTISTTSFAQVSIGIAVNIAPPPLPMYEQPYCPGPNYIWTPGYWAWNGYDYYWVPGTWVLAPAAGLLWTPGYWGWGTGGYLWHAGYWGPYIGFYGGVNYGYGYYGHGYEGGYWRGNNFYYNTAISRVNTTYVRNVYVNRTVVRNVNTGRVSYNGGRGGINVRPDSREEAAMRERRMGPVNAQTSHQQFAQQDKANFFKNNRGTPAHAAFTRPATSAADYNRNAEMYRNNRPANNNVRPGTPQQNNNINRPGAHPSTPQHNNTVNRPVTRPSTPMQSTRPTPTVRPSQPSITRPTAPQQTARPTAPQIRPENRPAPAVQQPRQQMQRAEPQNRPEAPRGGGEHPRF